MVFIGKQRRRQGAGLMVLAPIFKQNEDGFTIGKKDQHTGSGLRIWRSREVL